MSVGEREGKPRASTIIFGSDSPSLDENQQLPEREAYIPSTAVQGGYSGMQNTGNQTSNYIPEGIDDNRIDLYAVYQYARYSKPTHYFQIYNDMHVVNPYYNYYLDFTTNQIYSNYHFEGKDAKEGAKWWRDTNLYTAVRQWGELTNKFGTGISRVVMTNKDNLGRIQPLYTPYFDVDRDERTWDEKWSYKPPGATGIDATWQYGEPNMPKFVILRPFQRPEQVWGYSLFQTCVHALRCLHAIVIEDIPAASRNFMTVQRVIKANLDGCENDAQMKSAMLQLQRYLTKFQSAKSDTLVIHDKHDIGYMGSLTGGGMSNRLENMTAFLEPLLNCIMLNIRMAIGLAKQEGANKSIIKRQEWKMQELLQPTKDYFADEIYRQIIKPFAPVKDFRLVHDLSFEMKDSRDERAIKLYQGGLIPREYAQVQIEFDEDGFKEEYGVSDLTYIEDVQIKIAKATAPSPGATGGTTKPKLGSGSTDTNRPGSEGEKGEENDSVSGTKSEVKG